MGDRGSANDANLGELTLTEKKGLGESANDANLGELTLMRKRVRGIRE